MAANATDEAPQPFIINEVLFYISSWAEVEHADAIIDVCSSFFTEEEIVSAKKAFFASCGSETRLKTRRGGVKPKALLDLQDLMQEYYAATSAGRPLPSFYAKDAKRVPSRSSSYPSADILNEVRKLANKVDCSLASLSRNCKPNMAAEEEEARSLKATVSNKSSVGGASEEAEGSSRDFTDYHEPADDGSSNCESLGLLSSAQLLHGRKMDFAACVKFGKGPAPLKKDNKLDNEGFQVVSCKKKAGKSKVIRGTGVGVKVSGIARPVRRAHLFVTRCSVGTTAQDIQAVMEELEIADSRCTTLKLQHSKYTAFHLSVPENSRTTVMKPDIWGEGIEIRRFMFSHKFSRAQQAAADKSSEGEGHIGAQVLGTELGEQQPDAGMSST